MAKKDQTETKKTESKEESLPSGFEEVGDHWEAMIEFVKPGDFVIGELLEVADSIGPNKSMVYILDVNRVRTGVWGSTILDRRMKFVEPGDEIMIKYLGKATNPKTDREYHDFKVAKKRVE